MKLSWKEYFTAMAQIAALRSKDPNTKVGAIIANKDNIVIGTGYNGMPQGDDTFPWDRDATEKINQKYSYVIHAEINALLNSIESVKGSTIFVTLFPCSNCAKLLAHAGIKKVVYADDKYSGTEDDLISKNILKKLNIETEKAPTINVEIKK